MEFPPETCLDIILGGYQVHESKTVEIRCHMVIMTYHPI